MTSAPNPSGLCLCGCGEKTTISEKTVRERGYKIGVPRRYVRGHVARMEWHKQLIHVSGLAYQQLRQENKKRRLKALEIARRERAKERKQVKLMMQERRKRTQKLGPYKAGITMKARAAADKIEAAMRRAR